MREAACTPDRNKTMGFLQKVYARGAAVEHERLRRAYREVFSGAAGQIVLEDLCAVLRQVRWPDKSPGDMADARAFRDGQRSVALRLAAMLDGDATPAS